MKNSEYQSEIAAREQKTTSEKANFCSNTVLSLYFKIRATKILLRETTPFFAPLPVSAWPKSLLQFDFKNHENEWTNLKKRQRSNTIQIRWIVKTKRRPIKAPAIAVRLSINKTSSYSEQK